MKAHAFISMKEQMALKTPLLQSGVIAAGANWNPRYHPVFITHWTERNAYGT